MVDILNWMREEDRDSDQEDDNQESLEIELALPPLMFANTHKKKKL